MSNLGQKEPASSKDDAGHADGRFRSGGYLQSVVPDGEKGKEKEANICHPKNVPKPGGQQKDPSVPDRSFGDYYCSLCDSHMNCFEMWMAHVGGKRHVKNVKKGDKDSKYEELDIESDIKDKLTNVKDPIVGLSYIHEIRRKEANVPPFYTCFLCQATLATVPVVIEHVISMKHRLNYIKQSAPSEFELLSATNLKSHLYEALVEEAALKLENKFGRGKVLVKREKQKAAFQRWRTYFSSDDDDDTCNRYAAKKRDMHKPSYRKSADSSKVYDDKKERSYRRSESYYSNGERSSRCSSERSCSRDRHTSPRSKSDDYRRRSKYDDDYSGHRNSYKRKRSSSPKYESKRSYSNERVRERDSPKKNQLKEYYSQPSYNLLPHEAMTSKTDTSFADANDSKRFVQQIFHLPNRILLRIFDAKLENMEITSTEELALLSKIIAKAQKLFRSNLPPDLQDLVKQRSSTTFSSTDPKEVPISSPSASYSESQAASNAKQSDLSFLKEMIKTVNGAKSIPQNQNAEPKNPYVNPSHNSYSSVPSQNTLSNYAHYNAQTNIYVNPGFALVRNRNPNAPTQPPNNYQSIPPQTNSYNTTYPYLH